MSRTITPVDFGGDYRQHPDSRTHYVMPQSQRVYECADCGWWTMDGRYFELVMLGDQLVHVCADRAGCLRRQARLHERMVSRTGELVSA